MEMQFKVNKDSLIRTLESIMETQQTEKGIDATMNDVAEQASDMLLTIVRLPVEFDTVIIGREAAEWLIEFV